MRKAKAIWTLNVNNYEPQITEHTYPLLQRYADKCGAEFRVITDRHFPDFPPAYEKLQIHELGKDYDWNTYIDSDTIVHPGFFDISNHITKDTVCHNLNDMAGNRWKYDKYFLRDGRHIGSCNWLACASNWCLDLWKPLDDLTLQEAIANIYPTTHELATHMWKCQNKQCGYEIPTGKDEGDELEIKTPTMGLCTLCGQPRKKMEKAVIDAAHLLDDYTLSRNIARYGLKFTTVEAIKAKQNDRAAYLWHIYTLSRDDKIKQVKEVLKAWGLT